MESKKASGSKVEGSGRERDSENGIGEVGEVGKLDEGAEGAEGAERDERDEERRGTHTASEESIGKKKRAGRPKGSKNKPRQGETKIHLDEKSLARHLKGAHEMLALLIGKKALIIDMDEATMLSTALIGVANQYDMQIFSPKTMAWLNLGFAASVVYGPRLMMMRSEAKAVERKSTVYPFSAG